MSLRLLRIIAWSLLAAIAFVTLSPIGLRPVSGFSANYERLFAFAVVGIAFALAYPRHIWLVLALIVGVAVGLEALQLVAGGRHSRMIDLIAKLLGGGLGVTTGATLRFAWYRLQLSRTRA